MKTLLLTLLVAASAYAAAPTPEFKYDPNSPSALAAKAEREGYERDGQALRTYDLYNELVRLDAARKSRRAMAKPEDFSANLFTSTDDDIRASAYQTVLQKRGENGDPYASFYYAVVAGGVVAHLDGVDYWRRNLTPVGV